MRVLYQWVANITFYFIFITVVSNLLPNKKYEKYCRLFMGMVLILLVIQPLTASLRLEDRLAYYFESITFQNESEDLKKELLGMETQRLQQMIAQYEEAV
ncbi:MAG: stage III sporulation protein AF, partial [Hungatella sp.]